MLNQCQWGERDMTVNTFNCFSKRNRPEETLHTKKRQQLWPTQLCTNNNTRPQERTEALHCKLIIKISDAHTRSKETVSKTHFTGGCKTYHTYKSNLSTHLSLY